MTSSRTHILRKSILLICSSRSTGIIGLSLWNRIYKHTENFTRVEFDEALYYLRDRKCIICTNKYWRLTDYAKNNWQEVLGV